MCVGRSWSNWTASPYKVNSYEAVYIQAYISGFVKSPAFYKHCFICSRVNEPCSHFFILFIMLLCNMPTKRFTAIPKQFMSLAKCLFQANHMFDSENESQ